MSLQSLGRALRTSGFVAVALLLVLTLLEFPSVPYDVDHDLSSSASLEYFATHGVQFGTDLVQNVGPLGWVHYGYAYAGYLHAEKLVLKSLTRVVLAMLVLWACTRLRSWAARAVWLLAFVVLIPIGSEAHSFRVNEAFAYLSAYLSGLVLLGLPKGPGSVLRAAPALVLLAFLALTKHTLLVVSAFVVLAVVLDRLRRREERTALALALSYASFLVLIWVLAGQRLANLPEFGLGVFRFTEGYNEAMGLPAVPPSTSLGLAAFGGLAALILIRAVRRTQSLAKSAIDAFFLIVVWKHAFVRADTEHVTIFFHTAVFLALLFGLALERPPERARGAQPGASSTSLAVASVAVALFCALALFASIPDAHYRATRVMSLWGGNLEWLVSPGRRSAELARELEDRKQQFALPEVRQRVGRASIDFFGFEPGWLLLNDLVYVPRPMPITFAASNTALLRRNEAFYRDPNRAPQFILARLGSIDARLAPLDDGLALGAILDNYQPAMLQDDLLLLERSGSRWIRERAERPLLQQKEIGFGEPLSLAAFLGEWIWLEVDVQPSLLGRARSLVRRPARVLIILDVEGREHPEIRKFVTSMGTAGFLISPLIESSSDLLAAYAIGGPFGLQMRQLARVRTVRFECARKHRDLFEPRIVVRVRGGSPPLLHSVAKPATAPGAEP